ncbi:YdcF family protein [Lutibaculum baratangense]|uniref:Putative membrane protein n=1 Tax=Lutibaculum baratangense AMV1 TaxID=631454 RepID=V4TL66_9HYPH|nr:YdcF family protein [Lutibaculum baratangense]ESR26563.1 putative membrane protein [Lutibaculum baratangense AMV1]
MFYVVSKIAWLLLAPSNVVCLLLVLGAVLLFTRFYRWGRGFVAVGALLLLTFGFTPLGHLLILPLEERFPPPASDAPAPDGIIVLGGSFDTGVTAARGQVALNEAGERLTAFAALASRYPESRLVFSGGSTAMLLEHANEAETARLLLESMGLGEGRLLLEDRSRNTAQNAQYSAELVQASTGERWLLVTSAWHMPRAVGAFRTAGLEVAAYPVDYRTRGWGDLARPFEAVSEGLKRMDIATREWIGLVAYRLTGKTPSLLPAVAK